MPFWAGRSLGLMGRQALAPQDVFLVRYHLKVGWVNTGGHTTQVVDNEPLGYAANGKPIQNAVGLSRPNRRPQVAVPVAVLRGEPQPASAGMRFKLGGNP